MAQDITSALPDAPAMDMKAAPVAVASDKVNAKQQEKGSRVGKVAKLGRQDLSLRREIARTQVTASPRAGFDFL